MTAELTASSLPAGTLFSRFRFEVPDFQREYAWRAKDEVTDFFHDLQDSLESDFYFLGLVVLTGDHNERNVVDGQQRILTLSLLAAALRSEANELGRSATANEIHSTFLSALDYESDQHVLRVRLTAGHDAEAFRNIVQASDAAAVIPPPEGGVGSLLLESSELLRSKLAEDLKSSSDSFKRIGLWTRFLKDSVHFAVFDHPDPASAYRVFEVVNTRGRGLTPSDLIKSYVLSKSSQSSKEAQYRRWTSISDRLRDLGHSPTLPQFIRHSISARRRHVQPRDLYDEITVLYPTNRAVSDLLDDLEADFELYVQMIDPSQPGPASDGQLAIFSGLNELGVVTLRPILLALHNVGADDQASMSFLRLIVRRIVVGYLGTGAVERRLGAAATNIGSGQHWSDVLADFRDLDPDEDEFLSQIQTRSLNKRVVGYLHASALANSVDTAEVDYPFVHQIRPRRAPGWDGFNDEEALIWTSTLGNACLASVERRPRNSNSWDDFRMNVLPVATTAADGFLDEQVCWTPDEVREHAAQLGNVLLGVWYD